MASLLGLILLGAAEFYGGWAWALLSFIVLAALWRVQFAIVPMLATMGVSFFWLALFHWTEDRRLFFPYTIQFAVQMMYLMRGRVPRPAVAGGGGTIAVFTLIRIAQSATAAVLIVELLIATAILTLVLKACGENVRGSIARVIVGVLGSTLAFAGLAL